MKLINRLLILMFLTSCYGTATGPDFNMNLVEPADSMVTLLTDLHLADGEVSVLKNKEHTAGQLSSEYFEAILKKHDLTREEFEESMRYYSFHTEELDKIYEEIITNLSLKESIARTPKDADTQKPVE
jgi:hypothetical protein